jgi:3-deoxy-7-phosphoheptulonate synthase
MLESRQIAVSGRPAPSDREDWPLVARAACPGGTVVRLPAPSGRSVAIGDGGFTVMAGPCAVEDHDTLLTTAAAVRAHGATVLRGGAYKPRTSPYSFQGLRERGLTLLAEARARTGLPIVSEILDAHELDVMVEHVDLLQVGARNMQNFSLLHALGRAGRPVLLKRGLCATIKELVLSAEHIAAAGNDQIVLCERGIRTFEPMTRNTLDLTAVPLLKRLTRLPVLIDPSHATGDRELVPPLSRAALAVGADGLIIEVHPDPTRALSDGPQSLTPTGFAQLMTSLRPLALALGVRL